MSDDPVVNIREALAGLSVEDQLKAREWMAAASHSDDEFDQSMLAGILAGHFRIRFNAVGRVEFTLTAKGRDLALDVMTRGQTPH
jgi:hypothetical protein